MYTLKFNNITIGKYENTDKTWEKLKEYLSENLKFKSYYFWCTYLENSDDSIRIDYGSHNDFFYILKERDDIDD